MDLAFLLKLKRGKGQPTTSLYQPSSFGGCPCFSHSCASGLPIVLVLKVSLLHTLPLVKGFLLYNITEGKLKG